MHTAAASIKEKSNVSPEIGMITGSGLGGLLNSIKGSDIHYTDIPGFPNTTVEGHPGTLKVNDAVAVCGGRFHYYEGHPIEDVVFPVFLLHALGVKTLILTNASGGINASFSSGDIAVITDHLNIMGVNPLREVYDPAYGPRFPDISTVYAKTLISLCHDIDPQLKEGVYAAMQGPSYETPAEITMLQTLGADMVGMSTVPEAITAGFLGMQVAGLSCITNLAAGRSAGTLSHEEVLATAKATEKRLITLILKLIERLSAQP
ncbi:MAG: purine-nucleoside phosphorylase [Spirochaetales bacterium]|nr:purine-nucleoside phosphorylase [Spirochaetales bacterium]